MLANLWTLAAVPPQITVSIRERLIALRLLNGHAHRVAHRPHRIEPRAVKRRPAPSPFPLALLTELRSAAKARLIAGPQTSRTAPLGLTTSPHPDAPNEPNEPDRPSMTG